MRSMIMMMISSDCTACKKCRVAQYVMIYLIRADQRIDRYPVSAEKEKERKKGRKGDARDKSLV